MNSPEPARRPRVHEFRRLSGAIEDLDHESICVAPNKSDGLGIAREFFDCFDRHGSSRHISAEHDQIDVRALDILKHRTQCMKIPMKMDMTPLTRVRAYHPNLSGPISSCVGRGEETIF